MRFFGKKRKKRKGARMTIESIMTRDVATCGPNDMLDCAAEIMWNHDCGCVPIVEDEQVVGMVTDRDACMAAYTKGEPLRNIRIGDVMATKIESCSPREAIAPVEERMRHFQIRRMPVIEEDGRLVGLVSLNDMALAAERGRDQPGYPTREEVADTLAGISHHRPQRPERLGA
jgi:CBS domain-containing protein